MQSFFELHRLSNLNKTRDHQKRPLLAVPDCSHSCTCMFQALLFRQPYTTHSAFEYFQRPSVTGSQAAQGCVRLRRPSEKGPMGSMIFINA